MPKYSSTKLIEIDLISGTEEYSLGQQNLLENKTITSIFALSGGKSLAKGNDVINPTNAYLILKTQTGDREQHQIPLKMLTYNGDSGAYPVLAAVEFEPQQYSWQESFIRFGRGSADTLTTGNVIQLMVVYEF